MKIKIIILVLFSSISIQNCLTLDDICVKRYECDGKHCQLFDCTGSFGYNCNRHECSSNAETCDEYHLMLNELNSKKNSKLDRAFTEGLIRGISVSSKRLQKFEILTKKIRLCPL